MSANEPSLTHLLEEKRVFPPSESFSKQAIISSMKEYADLYQFAQDEPDLFWLKQSEKLQWIKKPTHACKYTWNTKNNEIKHTWFDDGSLNVAVNCLDRHLEERADKTALIWQGEQESSLTRLSYLELHQKVLQCASALRDFGVKKGDTVALYLPMIPELVVAMLACARIGAIHTVIFGGFSADSIEHRINDCQCTLLITANSGKRVGKTVPLKETVDQALKRCPSVKTTFVVKRDSAECVMVPGRDFWYEEVLEHAEGPAYPEEMAAEDPLFILYTSGSTGKPKGVVHTQAGYLLYAQLTTKYVFDLKEDDIYWCTADLGWITGHSYVTYGPLASGATILLFEGIPTYPHPGRFWEIIDHYKVTVFYTAPTVIRALICHGNELPLNYSLESLRLIGTVGEPINPEVWMWYYEKVGKGKCPLVDTWWQTETGGILLTPLPGCMPLKPGSCGRPFFGIEPVVLQDSGSPSTTNQGGNLCIKKPWPGIMRTLWGDHQRFIDTYFKRFDNLYFSGDGCRFDEEGDFWMMGRIDDVVNVSGHRIGTAEVESALVASDFVAEAAVVPMPHPIKGQALFAFVILVEGVPKDDALNKRLNAHVRELIGAIASIDKIQFVDALPKTRSGKIMRRILRKIVEKDHDNLGDLSTLSDPSVIETLIRQNEDVS